jgi:hypothetical protein
MDYQFSAAIINALLTLELAPERSISKWKQNKPLEQQAARIGQMYVDGTWSKQWDGGDRWRKRRPAEMTLPSRAIRGNRSKEDEA